MGFVSKPLIKETSTTTGTGSYALDGAVGGFLPFTELGTPAATLHCRYIARMGSGYEIGYGTLSGASTLERTHVIASSNANSAVSWAAGAKDVYVSTDDAPVKHRSVETAPPGSTDNYTAGYSFGSLWWSAHQRVWVCIDPGTPAAPSAVWVFLADEFFGRFPGPDSGYAVYLLGAGTDVPDATTNLAAVVGDGASVLFSNSFTVGFGWDGGQGDYGGHMYIRLGGVRKTTNATPTVLPVAESLPMTIPQDAVWRIKGTVVAYNVTDNVASSWDIACTVKRLGSADPVIVGTADVTMAEQDAGAAAWAVALTINSGNKSLDTTVTGQAAKNIVWTMNYDVTHVAVR